MIAKLLDSPSFVEGSEISSATNSLCNSVENVTALHYLGTA